MRARSTRTSLVPVTLSVLFVSAVLVGSTALVAGCDAGGSAPAETPAGPHPVPDFDDGKTDNYVSTNAREFVLSGVAHAALPDDFDTLDSTARPAALDRAVQARLAAVTRAVQKHIEGVVRDANEAAGGPVSGEDAKWFIYARRGAAAEAQTPDILPDGRARFAFALELVGSPYLMSIVAPGDGANRTFEVTVADDPWSTTGPGETVVVEIEGSESRDAFPRYDLLFADGVYDIAVHFGGDYNEGRFDLETARWTVETLLAGGWQNDAVATFEELAIDSPPFTRTIEVEGASVAVRVHVYHSDMVEAADEARLREVMETSLAERDVVIYSGHAGEGAGFVLDYQPRFEIPARDFAALPLADKYQIYILDGCRTYRTYVDDLMANPHKTFANVDIVTTINTTPFAVGYQMIHQVLYWLTFTDGSGRHFPLSWQAILRGLNTDDYASVHYGVHGVDDDPQLNPHGADGVACQPCAADSDCGPGGNYCLGYTGGAACGVACTTDTACGPGYRCARLFDADEYFYVPKQCVRRDYVCPAR